MTPVRRARRGSTHAGYVMIVQMMGITLIFASQFMGTSVEGFAQLTAAIQIQSPVKH